MSARRRVIVPVLFLAGLAVWWSSFADGPGGSVLPREPGKQDSSGTQRLATGLTDAAPGGDEVTEAPREQLSEPALERPPGFWPLDNARHDEHGILIDLKPYLHKTINGYAEDRGKEAHRLDVAGLADKEGVALSGDDQRALAPLLASHAESMVAVGPAARLAVADAYHDLIEGDGMQMLARGTDVHAQQRELLADLKNTHGENGRGFVWCLAGGPLSRDPHSGKLNGGTVDSFFLALHRGTAPQAFELLDEVNRIRDDARRIIREYTARTR